MAAGCKLATKAADLSIIAPFPAQHKEKRLLHALEVHHPQQSIGIEAAKAIHDWRMVVDHRGAVLAPVMRNSEPGPGVAGSQQRHQQLEQAAHQRAAQGLRQKRLAQQPVEAGRQQSRLQAD